MAKKEKTKPEKKAKKAKGKKGQGQIFMILGGLTAAIMFSSTLLLLIGMLPTMAALFADQTKRKTQAISIGAMNLAGCSPFLFQLWLHGNSPAVAVDIILSLWPVVIMYAAAGVGYIINWAVSGATSSILFQRGKARQKTIVKLQKELVERWGPEVTGELPMDERGFALPGSEKKT